MYPKAKRVVRPGERFGSYDILHGEGGDMLPAGQNCQFFNGIGSELTLAKTTEESESGHDPPFSAGSAHVRNTFNFGLIGCGHRIGKMCQRN